MPGPASHLTIIRLQTAKIAGNPGSFGPVTPALMNHTEHAALGSIGPDMLFWADWGEFTPMVNAIFDVYKTFDEIYEMLSALWEPIGSHINKELSALSGGLTDELQETLNLVDGILKAGMLKLITQQIDIFGIVLKPDMQKNGSGSKIENWNWLDYTHHRWTGEFAKTLIHHANQSGDPALMAYAYGWLSHVTADVVGHAYVNTAVGGPYRSHWQRHIIQEKFMDTWVWGFYNSGASMPSSAQPGDIPFDYSSFTNINSASLHEFINLGDDMPWPLQNLIAKALSDVYQSRPHPNVKGTIPFLKEEHINRAYQMLIEGLEIMTAKDRFLPRPEPPSFFNDDAPPTFPIPGGGSGSGSGGGGGSFSLLALLQAILDFISDLIDYLHDLLLWLISQVTTPLTFPVRYGLYLFQYGLYVLYREFQWALVMSGYAFPDPDQLSSAMAQQFINPFGLVNDMPHREWPPEQVNCIVYPASCNIPQTQACVEPPTVSPGPYTRYPLNYPYWFIEGEPSDPIIEKALMEASTPQQTASITRYRFPKPGAPYKGSLGSAIDFFLRRATEIAADNGGVSKLLLPNWNLDADRGYGFRCWEVVADASVSPPVTTQLEPPPASGVLVNYLNDAP